MPRKEGVALAGAYKITMDPKTGKTIYTDTETGVSENKGYTQWGMSKDQSQSDSLKASSGGGGTTSPSAPQQSYRQSSSQSSYQNSLTKYQNMLAEQAAKAKQDALRQAWESNSQALNSQKSTVTNNYNSATNKLNAVKDARLPEFQQQRNAASADAAQTSRGVKELMAATGRYNSGFNRSEQLGVDLNRSNAISGITGAQNQFETDVGNQLSDVDAQRVAALNDIASKLQLGEKQYNDGTLSLTEQLESEKASGALKAFLDAQTRADTLSQQGIDNSFRQAQFDQNAELADLQQQWQQKQFDAEQKALLWEQQFQQQGYTADEAYRMAQLNLQRDQFEADEAYRKAALAKSGSSGGSGGSRSSGGSSSNSTYDSIEKANAGTRNKAVQISNSFKSGATMQEILNDIAEMERDGTATAEKYNTQLLRNFANSVPIDNWQYLPR